MGGMGHGMSLERRAFLEWNRELARRSFCSTRSTGRLVIEGEGLHERARGKVALHHVAVGIRSTR